jgi:hypothetical protein
MLQRSGAASMVRKPAAAAPGLEALVKPPVDPRIARQRRSTGRAAPAQGPSRPDPALPAARAQRVHAAEAVFSRIAGRHVKPANTAQASRPAVGAAAMGSSGSPLRAAQGDDDLMSAAQDAATPAAPRDAA